MDFNEKLRKMRKEAGMTQQQLADSIGVTRASVTKWELGENTPHMQTLKTIAELFGVPTGDIVDDTVNASASFMVDISDLSPTKRMAVMQFIEFQRYID